MRTSYIQPPEPIDNSVKRRVLVIHAHPDPNSFSAHLVKAVESGLAESGHQTRIRHLYASEGYDSQRTYNASNFSPSLSQRERQEYHDDQKVQIRSKSKVLEYDDPQICQAVEDLRWCDSLVFVYPTWSVIDNCSVFDFSASITHVLNV